MPTVKAIVSRYIDDEPQPGIVECILTDAFGNLHFFVEKTAVVSAENLVSTSAYPVACELACEIEAEWNEKVEGSVMRVCTERPWGLESISGETRFVVRSSQVVR
jgi:hypothetical protein